MGRRKVSKEKLRGKKDSNNIEEKSTKKRRNPVKQQDNTSEFRNNEKSVEKSTKKSKELNKKLTIEKGIKILNNQKEKEKKDREERIINNIKEINKKNEEVEEEGYQLNKTILFILIFVISIVVYLFFEIGPIFGINLNKEIKVKDQKSIDIITSPEDIYDEYMSELLIYSNHKVSTYNKNSKKTWEYDLVEQFTPNIYIKDKYLAITNNSTGNIYLFEDKKEILNMKVEGKISNLYFDSKGNFAVDYSTNEYKKLIGVYNKRGVLLYNTYPSSKSIIDLKLIDNASKMLILEATSNSFKIGMDIYIIDSNSNDNSVKEIVSLDNCFAYDLTIVKDNIIILLDNEIISCNINTGIVNKIKTFDSNQMLFVGLSKNYYFSVEKELNNTDNYKFSTKFFDNKDIGNLELKVAPKMVKACGLLNYVVYQNNIHVINKWGIEVKNILIDSNPKDIIVFGKKTVALIYTNKVYIIDL